LKEKKIKSIPVLLRLRKRKLVGRAKHTQQLWPGGLKKRCGKKIPMEFNSIVIFFFCQSTLARPRRCSSGGFYSAACCAIDLKMRWKSGCCWIDRTV
jgi:hypothetical protein